MAGLGGVSSGTITYNGVDLAGGSASVSPARVNLSLVPRYDNSGRAAVWSDVRLQVQTTVWAGSADGSEATTAAVIADMREKLTQPSKQLTVTGLGLGSYSISQNSLNRGVRPNTVDLRPVAGGLAIEVTWGCTFAWSNTSPGEGSDNFVEFGWEASYTVAGNGLTTRTVSGYFVRASDSKKSVDDLRDSLSCTIPKNFRRIAQNFRESDDHMREDFTFVDAEQGGHPYPAGIDRASGGITWANNEGGFQDWLFTISATLTVMPGQTPALAGRRFFEMVFDRLGKLRSKIGNGSVIPVAFTMTPGLWDDYLTTRFSITFVVIKCLREVLLSGVMWDRLPDGDDWTVWQKSVDPIVGKDNNRGIAGLRMTAASNVIVTAESPKGSLELVHQTKSPASPTSLEALTSLTCDVKENESYIGYKTRISLQKQQNVSLSYKSAKYEPAEVSSSQAGSFASGILAGIGAGNAGGGLSSFGNGVAGAVGALSGLSGSSRKGHVTEYHGEPHTRVLIEGVAMRIKYKPEIVEVKTIANKRANELDRFDESENLGSFLGCPVYMRRWWILYDVEGEVSSYEIQSPRPQGDC